MMSFLGRKYRRKRCTNMHEMVKHSTASLQTINNLVCKAPVFSFNRLDERTFVFKLILQEKVMAHKFRLGEEFEMERHDGTKVRMTYTLEGDNVLNQVVRKPNGKVINFRREFGICNKMIVTSSDMDEPAVIYYDVVE